jgi:N-methylhydantoinase A
MTLMADSSPAEFSDAEIGVDVGGTHTDVAVRIGSVLVRGKALTSYDDFSLGMLEAISVAAEQLGMSLGELLAKTKRLINGTTVVTNSIAERRGAKVGVLVTTGFKDVFRIAGGPRLAVFDDHLQSNVPDLVDRSLIAEVDGRFSSDGSELVPLAEGRVLEAARALVDAGAEAIAVCFLMSHLRPEHELRAEELVREIAPDSFVSLSHRIQRREGENRRWTAAVLNAFVHANAETYLNSISDSLAAAALREAPTFFQGVGGAISRRRAERIPLLLHGSGPAGGAIGANELGRSMGVENILIGDMGGTSFDTAAIEGNQLRIKKNVAFDRFETGLSLVDVVSIGAGGGSIAWVSERGVPQVGPRSARSTPGPACYGRGGQEPTVTDAMLVLGIMDPDNYLGGRLPLRRDLAEKALMNVFGERFGWSAPEAAGAVHDLVVMNMARAIHELTVENGQDPQDFMFLAYGGTLPMFAAQIASALGVPEVVIPKDSSVFCARGLLAAEHAVRVERTVSWRIGPGGLEVVNAAADEMIQQASDELRQEGVAENAISIRRSGDLRFVGQVHQLSMDLPNHALTVEDSAAITSGFRRLYERIYGRGTAWDGVATQLVSLVVTATGRGERARQPTADVTAGSSASPVRVKEREIFLPAERQFATVPIYDGNAFIPGMVTVGPAIIDEIDTTIFVPTTVELTRDKYFNYRMRGMV